MTEYKQKTLEVLEAATAGAKAIEDGGGAVQLGTDFLLAMSFVELILVDAGTSEQTKAVARKVRARYETALGKVKEAQRVAATAKAS